MKIKIPYKPRYAEIHKVLAKHRFVVLVAHRRFGKTVLAVNHLLRQALMCGKPRGSFGYVAPLRNQAKLIAWPYLKHYSAVIPGRQVNESELYIQVPCNGGYSRIRIFGADNPDALRGQYFDGVVMDEVAQMKSEVWGEIIQPALADRQGGALFIGTPKGVNLFSELYYKGSKLQGEGDDAWAAMSYPVTKTEVLPPEEVERMRREMSDNAFRQEMLCDFSASSDDVLIGLPLVEEAQSRTYQEHEYKGSPLVLGVDVARFGDDASVLFFRRGLMAENPIVCRKLDNMALADRIVFEIKERKPDAVFIDAGGGAGVIDRLRQLMLSVIEVPFGGSAGRPGRYVNKRAEMWDEMRQWLKNGGALPPHEGLKAELSTPTYSFDRSGRIKLESKETVKERLLRSPDLADALALTFAAPVAVPEHARGKAERYDPLKW